MILDGGPCPVGIESTIVDLSSGKAVLLRPGHVSRAQLEGELGETVQARHTDSPRASGMLAAHYAPAKKLLLVEADDLPRAMQAHAGGPALGVLARRPQPADSHVAHWLEAPIESEAYAHDLYAALRALDAANCDVILVESPPEGPQWTAVRDRLQRAAAGSGGLEQSP